MKIATVQIKRSEMLVWKFGVMDGRLNNNSPPSANSSCGGSFIRCLYFYGVIKAPFDTRIALEHSQTEFTFPFDSEDNT